MSVSSISKPRDPSLEPGAFGRLAGTALMCLALTAFGAAADAARAEEPAKPATDDVTAEPDNERGAVGSGHASRVAPVETGPRPGTGGRTGQRVSVFGDPIVVASDEIVDDQVVCIGCDVRVEGVVRGDVVVIMGDVNVAGSVGGQLVGVMTDVTLGEGARVSGGAVTVLGSVDDRGAFVGGEMIHVPGGFGAPDLEGPLDAIASLVLWTKVVSLVLLFLAMLMFAALVPDRVVRVSTEARERPFSSFVVGLLIALIGLPLVVSLLTVSFVGIVAIPFILLLFIAVSWFGLAALAHAVGEGLGRLIGRELPILAALSIGFIVLGALKMIPWIGWPLWFVVSWVGLGAFALSRAGGPPTSPPRGYAAVVPPVVRPDEPRPSTPPGAATP